MAVRKQIKPISRETLRWRVFIIFALTVFCLLLVFPVYANRGIGWVNKKANLGLPNFPASGFNLGLDLQGGAHLIYQANVESIPDADRASSVEGVRDVIERRVRGGLGVSEPLVQTTKVGEDFRIIVELPGIADVNTAIKMIGETPVLEFKEENNEPQRELTADEKKQMNDFNAAAAKKAKDALRAVQGGKEWAAVVTEYSEDAASKNNAGDLGFITSKTFPEIFNWASTHKDGEVSKEAVKTFDGLNVVKRIAVRDGEKQVSASHLLICYQGAERGDAPKYTKKKLMQKCWN